jgi:hypothetical protein
MVKEHPIPPITHPLGKGWDQPDRHLIEIDETHAMMSWQVRSALLCYDCTLPTGAYEGKMWRRRECGRDLLCWFSSSDKPEMLSINYREILVV